MRLGLFSDDKKILKEIKRNARDIVHYLSVELGERTLRKYENLNRARSYILSYFRSRGREAHLSEETYIARDREVSNVIAELKGYEEPDRIIIIGAHYDTVEDTPGADDNATAIAALLEIFRLLSRSRHKKTVRFVAFTLEEPPFFSTDLMGSMKYAALCRERNENIEMVIAFDMLGYGSRRMRQEFPFSSLKGNFPPTANYLAVVTFPSIAEYAYLFKKIYNSENKDKIYDIIGPASIPGIDLSDHTSFVKNGYPAILLTDTAFYRNKNYHAPSDTIDTINFRFLTRNIFSITTVVRHLLNTDLKK
jgi:Zn-dependent M28 family amino/carboxypeptidase